MNPHRTWYAKKRDEMYRAYQVAIEMEDMELAEKLYKEYERYAREAKDND